MCMRSWVGGRGREFENVAQHVDKKANDLGFSVKVFGAGRSSL